MSHANDANLNNALNTYIANIGVGYIKLHNLHWNVVGSQFKAVHEYLESLYDAFADVLDETAELLKIAGEGARVEEVTAPVPRRAEKAAAPREDASYGAYEPPPDEEAEMFDSDELPDDDA